MRLANADEQRQYLQRWKTLGPILDSIRYDELQCMTEQEYLQTMRQLWSVNVVRSPRDSSGLVQWQRLFRK
jgi:hypothetical protein